MLRRLLRRAGLFAKRRGLPHDWFAPYDDTGAIGDELARFDTTLAQGLKVIGKLPALDGKVAFITGAARGQGRAHAVTLAKEGAQIIATDICDQVEGIQYQMGTQADLDETVALVEALDRRCVAIKVDARDGDYSGRRVHESVAESRARLGMDTLPLVLLHDPEFFPDAGFDAPGGAIEALVELRDAGVIGHLGIAAGHVPTIERLLDTGAFEVLLTHSRATLLDRSADALIDRARAEGLGVANAAVLGGGLLAVGFIGRRRKV